MLLGQPSKGLKNLRPAVVWRIDGLLDFFGTDFQTSAPPPFIQMSVDQNPEEPGARVQPVELTESPPCPQVCFLYQIVGRRRAPGKAASEPRKAPQMRKRDSLELNLPL